MRAHRNRILRMSLQRPIPIIPPISSSMKRIQTSMLIRINLVSLSIDHKARILDPVRIPSRNSIQMWMKFGSSIEGSIVESQHNVSLNSMNVSDKEVCDCCCVGNELCADSFGLDLVFAVWEYS